jgi:hypothetical protein
MCGGFTLSSSGEAVMVAVVQEMPVVQGWRLVYLR